MSHDDGDVIADVEHKAIDEQPRAIAACTSERTRSSISSVGLV